MKVLNIVLFLLLACLAVSAQPGNPGENPFIPVTGGILYLLLAGLGYGFYEIRKKIRGK